MPPTPPVPPVPPTDPGATLLRVEGLAKAYVPAKPVFADVSFTLQRGEFVCIIGPSGCGKTTLLRAAAGFVAPSAGQALHHGRRVETPAVR